MIYSKILLKIMKIKFNALCIHFYAWDLLCPQITPQILGHTPYRFKLFVCDLKRISYACPDTCLETRPQNSFEISDTQIEV